MQLKPVHWHELADELSEGVANELIGAIHMHVEPDLWGDMAFRLSCMIERKFEC